MPAPVPITIRYGNPTALGRLASAAGAAGYRRDEQNAAREDYQRRLAADMSFLNSEADRRAQDHRSQNDLVYRYEQANREQANLDRASELQTAYQDRVLGLREDNQNLDYQAVQDRIAAQKSGLGSARGRAAQSVELVPATGDITPRGGGTASMTDNATGETYTRDKWGVVNQEGVGVDTRFARTGSSGELVPRDVREQLDYIETLPLPEDKKNSLRVLARSGDIKIPQLADDARMMAGTQKATFDEKAGEKLDLQARQLDALINSGNESAVIAEAVARHRGDMVDPNGTTYEDALMALKGIKSGIDLKLGATPIKNSGGRTPTGGNPVKLTGATLQEQMAHAQSLPAGTWFVDPTTGKLIQRH